MYSDQCQKLIICIDEVGVDENIATKFPGATVTTGSAASGAGDNREIPIEEGGDIDAKGRPTKAKDFEGEGKVIGIPSTARYTDTL